MSLLTAVMFRSDKLLTNRATLALFLHDSAAWIVLCMVLRPRQHSIGHMGDGFTGQKTQPTVSKY